MLKSCLCDHIDAYILGDETITVTGSGTDDGKNRLDETNK